MRNFLLGVFLAVLIALGIYKIISDKNKRQTTLESSGLILQELNNVGKLVVTEGNFSEVITYKDAKNLYMDLVTAKKKAIVVVNAKATIAYDLRKIEHVVDAESKTVTITYIPEAEITITPDIKYHDLEADLLNQFTPEDHNLIRQRIMNKLQKQVNASTLKSNAKNRLLSELQKLYILTNSLGWKLVYNGNVVDQVDTLVP